MSCWQTDPGLWPSARSATANACSRARIYTLCEHFTLIGSGMIWNVYFGTLALLAGFFLATLVAAGQGRANRASARPSEWFIFVFRGSPLFIQFFFAYFAVPVAEIGLARLRRLHLGLARRADRALSQHRRLFGEIFYGALRSIPKGDVEAADAYGFTGVARFRRIIWPTMLRLAWPAYTNEAIFLFHATTLVFFSGFPAWQQRGDALYYANYFADKTFNPFVPYPILAGYFILLTLVVISIFGLINRRLNRHLPQEHGAGSGCVSTSSAETGTLPGGGGQGRIF